MALWMFTAFAAKNQFTLWLLLIPVASNVSIMRSQKQAILVPVDFTEAARRATMNALEVGEKLGAEVHLVNFIPPLQKKMPQQDESTVETISDKLFSSINQLKENEKKLAEMLKDIGSTKVTVHSEIKMDKLASGIKKQLKNKDIGLIVIGITGAHTIGDSFCKKSQVHQLIKVNCPIMICNKHDHEFRGHHKIVVSLDFDALDQDNIESLTSIAKKLSSEIYYIHINHPVDKKRCTKTDIKYYLKKHHLKADAIEVIDSDDKELAIRKYAFEHHADFIAINRFSKSFNYKGCHTEQVVEETENLVFVY